MSIFLLALIAAVISQVLGWIWHGAIFGKKWAHANGTEVEMHHGSHKEIIKKMWVPAILNLVVNYIMAFAVFLLLANFGVSNIAQSLVTAAVLFVGFVIPLQTISTVWNGKSAKSKWTTFLITVGFQLISFAIWALLFIWLA